MVVQSIYESRVFWYVWAWPAYIMYASNRKTPNNQCTNAVIVDDSISVKAHLELWVRDLADFILIIDYEIRTTNHELRYDAKRSIGTLGVVKAAPEMPRKIELIYPQVFLLCTSTTKYTYTAVLFYFIWATRYKTVYRNKVIFFIFIFIQSIHYCIDINSCIESVWAIIKINIILGVYREYHIYLYIYTDWKI